MSCAGFAAIFIRIMYKDPVHVSNMKLRSVAVLLLIMAIYFIVALATEHLMNGATHTLSIFERLLIGMFATGVVALLVHIEVPE